MVADLTFLISVLIAGMIVGAIFGFILQRGRMCMNSAFRDIILLKEYKLAKAVIIALVVCMIGFGILVLSGVVSLNIKPISVGAVVGGLIFGMGMVLAAGCASGTTYRVGEGMVGSLIALGGFGIGLVAAKFGLFGEVTTSLQDGGVQIALLGSDAVIAPILMIIIGAVGFVLLYWKWIMPAMKEKKGDRDMKTKIFKDGWSWYVTGLLIGIINVVAWLVAKTVANFNYPLGISGGWLSNSQWILTGATVDKYLWFGFIVLGMIGGAFIGSKIAGEFKLRAPKEPKIILQQLVGGIIMGLGAVFAAGCNIGNLLSGIPQFSLGSLVVGVCIVLGCWIMTWLMFMRGD
jgi:hypothetical protein